MKKPFPLMVEMAGYRARSAETMMGSKPLIGTISGSRAAAVVGLNPYMTQVQIWQDILEELYPGFNASRGYNYTPFDGNASTRWGHAFEDAVIKLAESQADQRIVWREQACNKFWNHRHYITGRAWIENKISASCHIDGQYSNAPGGIDAMNRPPLHEGKTTTERVYRLKWGEPGTNRVPQEYAIQVQHQMMCTGAQECIVSVLVFPKHPEEWEEMGWLTSPPDEYTGAGWWICKEPGENFDIVLPETWAKPWAQQGYFHQYLIKANPTAQEALKAAYSHFWSNYVIPQREPPCISYDDVKRLFIEPKGTIIVDPETESLCREYSAITKETGASGSLGKRKAILKRLLVDRMRRSDPAIDAPEREKTIFVSSTGAKLASFDGKTFRG